MTSISSQGPLADVPSLGLWARFWHVPLRAERLAFMRILLGVALLTDLLFQYWPNLEDFFGPHGAAPAGLYNRFQLKNWFLTALFFDTDDMAVIYPVFAIFVAATLLWLVGFWTRTMNVLVWFLTLMFIQRNPIILNGGDDTLQVGLFLLMLMPTGRALSIDAWLRRRRGVSSDPQFTPAWPVRVLQIQLCVIYFSTGLAKLRGTGLFEGTWWDGTSIHYVLNFVTMSRWSFVEFPVPFWLTALMTYICVWWEVLFTFLVLHRWTRRWALYFGLLFHLGIWFTIEVGWFSFYTMAFYGVWVPDAFWEKWDRRIKGNNQQAPG